jgi:hypothetical protein
MEASSILLSVNTTVGSRASLCIVCKPGRSFAVIWITVLTLTVELIACKVLMPWRLMFKTHLEATSFAGDLRIDHFFFV